MINVVSVRVGTKYPAEYVGILHDQIARNLFEEQKHWCVTDDPDSLPEGITPIAPPDGVEGWWVKCALFSREHMPWEQGDAILYMDLDVCVTGRLEELPKGIIKDWHYDCYNSSVMRWDHGEHSHIWDFLTDEDMARFRGDQDWIFHMDRNNLQPWDTFPAEWFVSYRSHAVSWPPDGAKAVIFHGKPDPHEVTEGWVPLCWKQGGMTALPKLNGSNTAREKVFDNIRVNVQRDLPWFTGFGEQEQAAVLVCGGPSLRKSLKAIRDHKRRGARIVTVNNAHRFLIDNGIQPDCHVMLDARPANKVFIEDAPEGIRYFLASQCDPSLFDAVADRDVVVWHNSVPGDELREILSPWWDEGPNQRACALVPGGGTVGLRALNLMWLSGYRKVHVYGMDSSYAEGKHHAYDQALNDGEQTIVVTMGDKRYTCAVWMARQANEFKEAMAHLKGQGVSLFVHGDGLIPDMWRAARG